MNEINPHQVARELFDDLLAAENPGRKKLLAAKLRTELEQHGAPLIDNNSRVTFFYFGDVQKVGLIGDMTEWLHTQYFTRIEDTNLFYFQAEFPPDARLEYNFMVDDIDALATDPLNPHLSLNGLGPLSELAMPGYRHHRYFHDFRSGQKGTYDNIVTHELPPGRLGYAHRIHVYRPPGYDASNENLPVIYLQDGEDYIEFAQVPLVLNQMIAAGDIEPLIAVFEAPPNRHLPGEPNRMTQYGMNDNYVSFFCDELVPFIDKQYRTRNDPQQRLVAGPSYGGLISAYIAIERPDVFGMAYSQSGYLSCEKDRTIGRYADSITQPLRIFVDVGYYERCVGAAFLPASETDFLAGNRRFREVLQAKKYDFIYREYPEGHTWGNWRRHLIDGLKHFFGKQVHK